MSRRKMIQLRYYGPKNGSNFPSSATNSQWVNGEVFAEYTNKKIIYIGIQGLPGTRFMLNNLATDMAFIGASGVFELNTEDGLIDINSIKFSKTTINKVDEEIHSFIIVDIIYED